MLMVKDNITAYLEDPRSTIKIYMMTMLMKKFADAIPKNRKANNIHHSKTSQLSDVWV